MKTVENKKSGQEVAKNFRGRGHVDFWRSRLYRKKYRYSGRLKQVEEWSVRIQHAGWRDTFALGTSNQAAAAVKAKEIATFLEANGWAVTKDRFKSKVVTDKFASVGEFEAELAERSGLKSKTLRRYMTKLRTMIAGIAGVGADNSRYDYVHGGNKKWREKVDRCSLNLLTTDAILEWRNEYISRSGDDHTKRKSAERSAASYIRCCRSLWSPDVVAMLRIKIPSSPFAGVKIKDPGARRYMSHVAPAELMRLATTDLNGACEDEFIALLLTLVGGLRRREADLLLWEQVNFEGNQIQVRRTKYLEPKTEESIRDVDMPSSIMAILRARMKRVGGEFVLGGSEARVGVTYDHYRADGTWRRLNAWLKKKGVVDIKAVHAMRKESGSLINQLFGVEAARHHLGHRDIRMTSSHYVAKKVRYEVAIGG